MTAIEIIPTCIPHSAEELAARAGAFAQFAQSIHVDIDDGLFTPEYAWPYIAPGIPGPVDISGARKLQSEIHLMVKEPRAIGLEFARAGAARITGHVEAFPDREAAREALDAWREEGAEAGLAILIDTPMSALEPALPACDFVLVMSIPRIGSQGAPFDERAFARVKELRAKHPELLIAVDGGVGEANIAQLVAAGATRFSVGSAISKSADPAAMFVRLKTLAENPSP